MTSQDPDLCRRALREIGEIAAVAVLDGSAMTEQEALQTIAAIAEWVSEETPSDRAGCGDRIRTLNTMTDGVDFDRLDDHAAVALFHAVVGTLQRPGAASSS
ncbi:hypothetical protein [Brevundimonas goettingensis]|jgi:hypothetical protein|uniref:Uncharacterized protein n=1 Tax=Brevundimonas goettingensis TaxID=2774190 RepID=A0A975C4T9_9CAUL|nr:hypothetical protein [Brevundimonas goettingensis]QTC92897.1 hypothetical protein IFJ75_08660 [Brevundimonas goettingensis]